MTGFHRVLVLGGKTGLVGQALMEKLQTEGWEALATDRSMVDFSAADAEAQLEGAIREYAPSCLINAVGYTAVDAAEDNFREADLLNRAVPAMAARVAARTDCLLVHYSTDFVFNGEKETPYTPEDKPDPISVYGKTKLAGEEAVLNQDGLNFLILRTAWIFGPGKSNFVRNILMAAQNRDTINVVNDQTGSPTYTLDLAAGTLKLIEAGARGIFHVVNAGSASWCELAAEAVRVAQVNCIVNPIPSSAYPVKAVRPAYSVLDLTAFKQATGNTPRPWAQALREYIYREFPALN